MFKFIVALSVMLLSVSAGYAAEECASCGTECGCAVECLCEHEPRAPIGVMGDHVHHKGAWMASYRYMFMRMDGVDGDLSGYMMKPVDMDMRMHMFGAMYTPINDLTIGLMLPYIQNDMNMTMGAMNMPMKMDSAGFGDLKLAGTYRLWSANVHQVLLNLGVSFPTGSIDEKNAAGARLPYPMQLGSGSYGLIPGVTYSAVATDWLWGAQANGTFYLNDNDNEYRLGNRYQLQGWVGRDLCASSALTLRLNGTRVENIDGADPLLNPMMTPLADPNLRAGTRLDLLAGVDYRRGIARLALEAGAPVYEELDGPQLKTAWMLMGGLQLTF